MASLVGVVGVQPAQAAIGDTPAYTYNMQGTASNGDNTWTLGVGPLLTSINSQNPVVALQEAGPSAPQQPLSVPDPPQIIAGNALTPLPLNIAGNLPPVQRAQQVTHSQWNYGGATRDVYFLQTDANGGTYNGGRVNLAIVTVRAADGVVIIPNPQGGRAALGVRFGTTWYFSVHAFSGFSGGGGGNDAPGLINNIGNFLDSRPINAGQAHEDALVLGDYNRDPNSWGGLLNANARIVASDGPTQNAGGNLDYGIMVDVDNVFPDGMTATVRSDATFSDHRPVLLSQTVAAEPTPSPVPTYGGPQVVESMQAGGVLDAFNRGTADFTNIDSFQRNGQSNQAWNVESYPDGSLRFQGAASQRCIDITNSTQSPGLGRNLSLFDCSDQSSQRWAPVYLGNDEIQLRSVLVPSLCMNVSGGQTHPATSTQMVLWDCTNTLNERFIITPWLPATGPRPTTVDLSTSVPSPTALENLHAGAIMDVFNNGTAINTPVIPFVRNGQANQGWTLDWHSNNTLSLRSTSANRCLDILNSTTATAGRAAVIFDCTGQASQSWTAVQLNNETVQFESVLNNTLCLDINGATGDPTQGNVDVNNCSAADTQQWMFTSFDPTGSPIFPTDPDRTELFTAPPAPNAAIPAQRVGYYTSWSTYANAFYPKALDTQGIASKLTVLNYAFENIDPVNLTCMEANKPSSPDEGSTTGNDGSSDAFADYQKEYTSDNSVDGTSDTWSQPLRGNFNQLKQLKAKYPNLKILLTIGGWTYSKFFSDVAATDDSRKKFVSSCIDMYIKGNLPQLAADPAGGAGAAAGIFDGFDIDWEFPGSNSGHLGNHVSAQDGANYTTLLNEFRNQLNALGGKHYTLTAALPAGPSEIGDINIPSVANALDLGDVMAYDFHGAFETTGPTNFQAPLYDSPNSPAVGTRFTANDAVSTYLDGGFPAAKLSLGVPFYGRGWTGVPDGGQHGRYQTVTGPTASFPLSLTPGVADWKELEAAGKTTTIYYDTQSESTWIYDGTNFWSIDTPTSLAIKRQYIQDRGLGGVMMYSLEADDSASTLLNAATGF